MPITISRDLQNRADLRRLHDVLVEPTKCLAKGFAKLVGWRSTQGRGRGEKFEYFLLKHERDGSSPSDLFMFFSLKTL